MQRGLWRPACASSSADAELVPATKHILACVTIKWAPDGFNLPTEDEKLGTNIFLSHCRQNILEVFSNLRKSTHSFWCSFCNSLDWIENISTKKIQYLKAILWGGPHILSVSLHKQFLKIRPQYDMCRARPGNRIVGAWFKDFKIRHNPIDGI